MVLRGRRPAERLSALLCTLSASPLAWVLSAMFVMHVIGITWGMPASDAWEDDGIAPRDFLVGVHDTYLPGHFFTYPPVHLITLTLLTSPVSVYALAHARSLAAADVVTEFIKVPYMTIFTLVARMVSALMSVGIAYALAKIAEEIRGKRAAVLVATVVALNVPFTYYAHTSNLDVPYLFWASFALLALVEAIARRHPRGLRRALLFAALAVGTKDQAYALFLLSIPLTIGTWFAFDREARAEARSVFRELMIGGAMAEALLLFVDGAITNPTGFAHRLEFLLGPASQDHAYYPATWAGKAQILTDLAHSFSDFYPWPFALLMVAGLVAHVAWTRRDSAKLAAGLIPFFAAVSFTICFNFAARRSEHRFALPQMTLLGLYAGLGVEAVLERCRTRASLIAVYVAATPLFAWAFFECLAMDVNLIDDPRYEAEAWLGANMHPGDLVEVYGSNCYLPRFTPDTKVTRVDLTPTTGRNPLPGMTELQARFEDVEARRPRWIILSEAWVWQYMDREPSAGHVLAPGQAAREKDLAAYDYFYGLHLGTRGYHAAHVARWTSTFWPRKSIHASTAHEIRIFQRD